MNTYRENIFYHENYLYKVYKYFWMLSEKKFVDLERTLQQLVKMAIYVSIASFSGMLFFRKMFSFLLVLGHWSKKISQF